MGYKESIYKNPEIRQKLMAIYNARIKQWPVLMMLDTRDGLAGNTENGLKISRTFRLSYWIRAT